MKDNTRCPESVTKVGTNDSSTKASHRRKPGKPSTVYVGVDSIGLTWVLPETFESGDFYQVSYKENSSGSGWTIASEEIKENKALLKGLASNCEYIFRVNCIYGETEGSLSDSSDPVKTLPSPASTLLQFSVHSTKSDVSPTKYSLLTTEIQNARNEGAKTRKLEIGRSRPVDWSEKTIMVIGETGTGKSTLVDGMVNYILGVQWSDLYRLTIVNLEDEENSRKHNQALSQTEWITCYKINHMDGSRIKYTLNIIDTPGFGDTRGLDRDNAIVDQIRELFTESGPKGILTIDAVCFLIKAPDARLTPMQRYIFQSIMSLFGKDIEKNICSMVTFADGIDPPVFAALDESGLPFGKRFTFNNSGLYARNTNIDQYSLSPMFWKMGMASFENFFTHLDSMQRRSLRLTGDVLNERNRLEATIKNLEPKLDAGLLQIDQLKKMIETFEDNQSIIKANKDFTYTTKKTQQKKSELPKGQHVTNCTPCTFTCHVNCSYPDNAQKRNCCAMDPNGYCTMCPDKCFWDKHANTPYIFTYEIIEETKTYSEMKEKYEKASGQLLTQEQLLDTMRQELEDMAETIEDMMDVVMECNQRLADIALRPNPLTMTDHVDLMIENEKNTKKEGWMERIQSLQKLKKRANILEHVDDFSKKAKSVRPTRSRDETNATKSRNVFRRIRDVFGI
ncbi:uncharacterized protein LOC127831592 [Dreissena polymorpha]|nr:uncharacterized protein LOC127831592 [Dreissena polymorpha]